LTELKDELSALSKKHHEAWESAVYISMNKEEASNYDQNGERIHELYVLLGKLAA
jgi:hypothetical protein